MWDATQNILGSDIELPDGVHIAHVSDGSHTFGELYQHRYRLFATLMRLAAEKGMEAGWSTRHNDGDRCFDGCWNIGWIVAPNGGEIRYHVPDYIKLPPELEKSYGRTWNGKEETLDALIALAS